MRNVSIVVRDFPPTGQVSVERVTKLVKYLPRFGRHPTVLTGATAETGLPTDDALLAQVTHAPVRRAGVLDGVVLPDGAGAPASPAISRRDPDRAGSAW